jgi:hypothetical protein
MRFFAVELFIPVATMGVLLQTRAWDSAKTTLRSVEPLLLDGPTSHADTPVESPLLFLAIR